MSRSKSNNDYEQAFESRFELSPEQVKALELLMEGLSVTDTAKELGVTRETVSRWRNKDEGFIAAYNDALQATWQASRNKLLTLG
jgi:DNA-binding MarR family transcriptional regulator